MPAELPLTSLDLMASRTSAARVGRCFLIPALVAVVSACATTSAADSARGEMVVSDEGRELWRGKAAFGVRSAREGRAERVVALPGVGEIQTGLAPDTTCRLVWSKDGLSSLVLYRGTACGVPEGGRMCFARASFVREAPEVPGTTAPPTLVVDGCADENDLLWSKLDGRQPATVGPRSFRQRCHPLTTSAQGTASKGGSCQLTYMKKDAIDIEHNDSGDDGFALSFDGDVWRACFLEKHSGHYRIALVLEDSCGGRSTPVIEGDSADLDD